MSLYRYALSITSQFPFCSIPFRLDSFSSCQFACRYCFAAARGGYTGQRKIQTADPASLERRLNRLSSSEASPRSVTDELLAARVPLHFGGMSDPFMAKERTSRVTLQYLKILQKHRYPTVLSTKSDLCSEEPYIGLLRDGNFIVQLSLSTIDDDLGRRLDLGAPLPSQRIRVIEKLAAAGVPTMCRIQPLIPSREEDAFDVVDTALGAGAKHVSVEHLKLPIESRGQTIDRMSAIIGVDLRSQYSSAGAQRIGREWILPVGHRLQRILELRERTWKQGATFGAADCDLLPLSDGNSCCSGIDLHGMQSPYRFTFTQAIKKAKRGRIEFASIEKEWRPHGSIGQFVNSNSRIARAPVEEYVREAWNGRPNSLSPASFHGVSASGSFDENGLSIYAISVAMQRLIKARTRNA
jgi:DNA repair photolyase